MIDVELRSKLLAYCPRVQQNRIYTGTEPLRIWFTRSGSNTDRHMDGTPIFTFVYYDVEVHGLNIEDVSDTVEAIKAGLDGTWGTWGTVTVKYCEVEDHSDDYVYRGLNNDAADYNVAAVKFKITTD